MTEPLLTLTRDPRLSMHATSAVGAWLWAADATHILWANAAGAALLGTTPAAALERRFTPDQPLAAQIARLAGSLPSTGAPRLDRLRGVGSGIGGALMCSCSRVSLAEGGHGVLVVATETVKPTLPLAERVQRLFADMDAAVAVYASDGALMHASETLRPLLSGPLAALDIDALAAQARESGQASGPSRLGRVALHRLGSGTATVLLAVFTAPIATEAPAVPAEDAPDVEALPEPEQQAAFAPSESVGLAPEIAPEHASVTAVESTSLAPGEDLAADETQPVETERASEAEPAPAAPEAPDESLDAIEADATEPVQTQATEPDAVAVAEATAAEPVDAPHDAPESARAEADAEQMEPASAEEGPQAAEAAEAPETAAPEPVGEAPAPPVEPTAPVAESPHEAPRAVPALERRSPLRFVWQIDADGHFTLATDEFAEVMGPRTVEVLGRSWAEIATALALDPDQRIARAIASRDTWSGIAVAWPVDGSDERAQVELSGLPAFDRSRTFLGYRGFGVCRDIARFADVIAARDAAASPATPVAPTQLPAPTTEAPQEADMPQAAEPPAAPPPEPSQAEEPAAAEARPVLTVVPSVQNVVPFRGAAPAADRRPMLTPVEQTAFKQIAEALGARSEDEATLQPGPPAESEPHGIEAPGAQEPQAQGPEIDEQDATAEWNVATEPQPSTEETMPAAAATPERRVRPVPSAFAPVPGLAEAATAGADAEARLILERMPVGVLVHRDGQLLYANRAFLEWTGYAELKDVIAAGGLDRLVADGSGALDKLNGTGRTFGLAARDGATITVEGRMATVPWGGAIALMLVLTRTAADERFKTVELARHDAEREVRELRAILDTATDGIIVIDRAGNVLSINRSAEALFGYEYHEIVRKPFTLLFAPESERGARDYLDGLTRNGVASVLNDGREVIGRVQQGGLIPLFMTMGRVGDSVEKFCAVFRDITQWKRAEEDLLNAKREAERASSAKSDFLAKISHEIRTPLNAIIGFSEVMMEERFGNVGNERYRQYLSDIHTSGQHLVSLINDLLDLSKIEAGKLDLVFASVNLNELVQQCVALMQPQANRERIIIRTSLSPTLPPVVIDARSVRQIVLNLLSNSIKFTGAGGQVIVSTALTERGEAVLRVRDTGIGMSEKEIETALEPFRQLSTSTRWGSGGTGLGLPLTKALAEANRATFAIKSATNAGTLVEITFPATRVLAE